MKTPVPQWLQSAIKGSTYALFLVACYYTGWINGHLKGAIPDLHRGLILIGFLIGAGSACSFMSKATAKAFAAKRSSARR